MTGNLEMDGTSKIDGSNTGIGDDVAVTVTGNMTMHGGSLITSAGTGFGDTAGTITINVGNYAAIVANPAITPVGVFTMETGSKVDANGGASGTANDITITVGREAEIDGEVLSQVLSGSTGSGGRDGGAIFVDTGCGLTVSETGVLSSRGMDQGADLVHLSSCEVVIKGLVESTTPAGHGIPGSPFNHCDHAFRPDKNANSTACVEVWADIIAITNTGQVNADIGGAGGTNGKSWIDLFANTSISIDGRMSGAFAVHADSTAGNSDNSPNTITAKAVNGTFSGSGLLFSAQNLTAGSDGGAVVVEADGNVTMDVGTVAAVGDVDPTGGLGDGGQISVKSFNGAVSWKDGDGDVRPATGVITVAYCTTVDLAGTDFNGETVAPTQGCGGNPTVPGYVDTFFTTAAPIWTACAGPDPSTKSGTKFLDADNNGSGMTVSTADPNWPINL